MGESEKERTSRKWNEMLQELRVAQTGVQVLTGFLLTVPFTQRFGELDRTDTNAYLVTVSASILAAGLLIAPVAFHRVLFGKSEKQWLIDWVRTECGWELVITKRSDQAKGFVVVPKRWVVERTFGWLGRYRRLSKDYEKFPDTSEAMIRMAMIHIMVRRLEPTHQYCLASQNEGVEASHAA